MRILQTYCEHTIHLVSFCMHVNEHRLTTLVQSSFRISQEVHFYFYDIQRKDVLCCAGLCMFFSTVCDLSLTLIMMPFLAMVAHRYEYMC